MLVYALEAGRNHLPKQGSNVATPDGSPPLADDIFLVLVTAPAAVADALAESLVAAKLAACVQVSAPMRSTYRWQGQVESAVEVQLQIKIRRTAYAAVEAHVRERHPYEVPEILAVPVGAGNPEYLQWIMHQTG